MLLFNLDIFLFLSAFIIHPHFLTTYQRSAALPFICWPHPIPAHNMRLLKAKRNKAIVLTWKNLWPRTAVTSLVPFLSSVLGNSTWAFRDFVTQRKMQLLGQQKWSASKTRCSWEISKGVNVFNVRALHGYFKGCHLPTLWINKTMSSARAQSPLLRSNFHRIPGDLASGIMKDCP